MRRAASSSSAIRHVPLLPNVPSSIAPPGRRSTVAFGMSQLRSPARVVMSAQAFSGGAASASARSTLRAPRRSTPRVTTLARFAKRKRQVPSCSSRTPAHAGASPNPLCASVTSVPPPRRSGARAIVRSVGAGSAFASHGCVVHESESARSGTYSRTSPSIVAGPAGRR